MKNRIGKAKLMRGKSVHTNKHRSSVQQIINLVVKEADIILEVLDSRFIGKTRNPEIEKRAKKLKKPLIYILNKADLVNTEKLERNMALLQELKPRLFFSSIDRRGKGMLTDMIEKEAKKIDVETANIGIIGYPNTGKSSLINLLVGRKISRTSPEAGYTRGIQKIKIAEGIYLIDTPGIIPLEEKAYGNRELLAKHAQIGAITWDRTKNPEMVVHMIMQEHRGVLEKHYGIDAKGDSEILLEMLGKRLHFLKKGNLVDETRTAKKILQDWQEGKINAYSLA